MKKIVYTTLVALLLVACSKEDDTGSGTGGGGRVEVTEATPVTSDLTVNPHYRQGMLPAGRVFLLQLTPFLPELKSATGQWTRLYRSRLLSVLLGLDCSGNRLYRLSGGCIPYKREWNRGYSWYYCRRCIQ